MPATATKKLNKSAWIRSQPASMRAKDVVAAGKASGIKLSVGQVYVARASAKKAGKRGPGRPHKNAAPAMAAASSGVEGLLKAAAAEVGLSRAMEILGEQRDAVRKLLER